MIKKIFGLACLFILLLMSCNEQNDEMGTLSVTMTDAPMITDVIAEAKVTVTKVEVRKSEEEDGSPFLTLFAGEETINLLELTNGVTTQLTSLEVPVGNYDLVRIYVEDAELIFKDQSSVSLKVPSGSSSGIKVFIDPPVEVAGGLSADLLLDFDLSRSFVAKGPNGSNGFNFKPTIKAVNSSEVGRIQGVVTDEQDAPISGAQVTVYAADTVNTSTFTNDVGLYTVLGMKPGEYQLVFEATDYSEQNEVATVVAGNATTINIILNP